MTAEPGPWWLVLPGGLAGQTARVAEADRGRAALLAAVSHDLRYSPAAAPPLLTARTAENRVELRVSITGRASRRPSESRCSSPSVGSAT